MMRKLFFGFSFFILSLISIYFAGMVILLPVSEATETSAANVESASSAADDKNSSSKNATVKTDKKEESAVAQTANPKTVKGKINEKTFDMSAANLYYNNVHIKNTTSKTVDLKAELLKGPSLKINKSKKPQILIVHTHTTECYMQEKRGYYVESDKTRSTNDSENIISVGEVLKSNLEKAGFGVVHAFEKHDYPEYTGSYNRAASTIKKYLAKYPDIKVVIDLHRDSITANNGAKTAAVCEINGKKAAQVMLVVGCEDQSVVNFPNWKENFKLAIKLQQSMEVMYPSLARPILFTPRRYNLNLTQGSMLIECGTEANTLSEAKYSAELVAKALAMVLNSTV